MKRTMSLALCVAVIMFSVVACKKKKKDDTTTTTTTTTPTNQITDTRDGKVYPFVVIGTQTWFATNLAYATPNSHNPCTTGADSCTGRGLLYNQAEAATACPSGYHLPSNTEWDILEKYLASAIDTSQYPGSIVNTGSLGTVLKKGGSSGFNAIMVGFYNSTTSSLGSLGTSAVFRTSTGGYRRILTSTETGIYRGSNSYSSLANDGYCVRCLKN